MHQSLDWEIHIDGPHEYERIQALLETERGQRDRYRQMVLSEGRTLSDDETVLDFHIKYLEAHISLYEAEWRRHHLGVLEAQGV